MTDHGKVLIHSIVAERYPLKLQRYGRILKENNIAYEFVDASAGNYLDSLQSARAYIHHYVHRETEKQVAESVLPMLESSFETPCFPNYSTRWHFDDKIKQFYLLQAKKYPCVERRVFWDRDSANNWLENASFPLVFKLKAGAGSKNVVLVQNKTQARNLVKSMFSTKGVDSSHIPVSGNIDRLQNLFGLYSLRQKLAVIRDKIHYQDVNAYWQRQRDYAYFQKFLTKNEFDTRITVIGNRAFAFRRHNRPNDFRASGSGRLDYNQEAVDMRCIKLAMEISADFGFQSMAYDFLFDENNEPMIGEISYAFVDKAVYDCPGCFDNTMQFCEGHYWPQFCILQDLLNEPDLTQPSLNDMMAV